MLNFWLFDEWLGTVEPRAESDPEEFSNDENHRKDEHWWHHLKRTRNHCDNNCRSKWNGKKPHPVRQMNKRALGRKLFHRYIFAVFYTHRGGKRIPAISTTLQTNHICHVSILQSGMYPRMLQNHLTCSIQRTQNHWSIFSLWIR